MTRNAPLIAVYGIYKNEENFIERYLESIKDADEIVLCDTGSTDGTNHKIKSFKESYPGLKLAIYHIHVSPWRFDDARNTALSLVSPEIDLCISLDIDEYLMVGWKDHLIKNYDHTVSRYNHKFTTIYPNGNSREHWHERIHSRLGYSWKLPVHEILEYKGKEKIKWLHDFWMYQKPEGKETRSSYLPLLEQSVKERKDVWKSWSFLAGEYLKKKQYDKALKAISTALDIKGSDKGYLYKYQYHIYRAQGNDEMALISLNQAILTLPTRREPRYEKAKYLHTLGRHVEALLMIREAEGLTNKVKDYHYNQSAWNGEFDELKQKLTAIVIEEGMGNE